MNMLLIAATSVPRGGVVTAKVSGPAGQEVFEFSSHSDPQKRQKTLIPSGSEGLLSGAPADGVDARGIQPFYTGLLARMTDMDISIGIENEKFFLTARPRAVASEAGSEVKAPQLEATDPAPAGESEPFSKADEKSA
jgi:histidine phosphotransferase ChpT